MRRLNTSTFLIIAFFLVQPADAEPNAESAAAAPAVNEPARPAGEADPGSAETAPPPTPDRRVAQPTREEICRIIEAAATREALPVPFFARLIWRESRFDPRAVSPAGAQGIAQFMPFVANGRGLADPFDPLSALLESAEYLGELLRRFGNVGLAAAAYNAGPKRVQDWLAKRGVLRQETRDYVAIITGHGPRAWAAGAPADATEAAEDFRCAEIHKIARRRPPASDAPELRGGRRPSQGRARRGGAPPCTRQRRVDRQDGGATPQGFRRETQGGRRLTQAPGGCKARRGQGRGIVDVAEELQSAGAREPIRYTCDRFARLPVASRARGGQPPRDGGQGVRGREGIRAKGMPQRVIRLGLRGSQRPEELVDADPELAAFGRELFCGGENLVRGRAGLARPARHVGDVGGYLRGDLRGFLDVA